MDQNKLPLDPHHLGVLSSVPKMISMPVAHSVQAVHLSFTEINAIFKQTEIRFYLMHVT
jgi:hypothetical protein